MSCWVRVAFAKASVGSWRCQAPGCCQAPSKVGPPSVAHSSERLVEVGATIDHIVDHGMTRSVYFLDPDGIEMELFCDTFDTEAERLAFMQTTPGQATPMDITAPEPERPAMPTGDYTTVR